MGAYYESLNNENVWAAIFNSFGLGCGAEGTYSDAFNGGGEALELHRDAHHSHAQHT